MTDNTTQQVTITLDGRQVRAPRRETVLNVARSLGIPIPTLCHHQALEPAGACRLCLVEVEKRGRTRIVTACNYPVEEGLVVRTTSEAVVAQRRLTAESLLARCPEVPAIKELAAGLGVERSRFKAGDDTCILCGLCTRVCESYVTAAISTLHRGVDKVIGPFDEAPAECVGCLACAEICPTDHIGWRRENGTLAIWDREFPLALCRVAEAECRGCGACEEACPFSVARIARRRDGTVVAAIDPVTCQGCGVCLSACPTGAITQPDTDRQVPAAGEVVAMTCARSQLTGEFAPVLPAGVEAMELPCTGAVSVAQVLLALATGKRGVVVLGRHEQTCRLDGSEDQARRVTAQAEALARLVGLGAGRVAFVQPAAGRTGPREAVAAFSADRTASPLREGYPVERFVDSLDGALDILTWLSGREELTADATVWLTEQDLPAAVPGGPVLMAGGLPYFDILLGDTLAEYPPGRLLADALRVLADRGIDAGVAVGGIQAGFERLAATWQGSQAFHPCAGCAQALSVAGLPTRTVDEVLLEASPVAVGERLAVSAGDEKAAALAMALGAEAIPVGASPDLGGRFTIGPAERGALEAVLVEAGERGAGRLLVSGPAQLMQYLLVCRKGAWRRSHVRPVTALTLATAAPRKVSER